MIHASKVPTLINTDEADMHKYMDRKNEQAAVASSKDQEITHTISQLHGCPDKTWHHFQERMFPCSFMDILSILSTDVSV